LRCLERRLLWKRSDSAFYAVTELKILVLTSFDFCNLELFLKKELKHQAVNEGCYHPPILPTALNLRIKTISARQAQ